MRIPAIYSYYLIVNLAKLLFMVSTASDTEDAAVATRQFLDRSFARGLKKVHVITGKGIHSKNGEAVLRPSIIRICRSPPKVREVTVHKASEGGSGALTVIFKSR